MNLNQIASSTVALIVAAGVMLLVGAYTNNGGFQLAGVLVLLPSLILAIRQANRQRNDP